PAQPGGPGGPGASALQRWRPWLLGVAVVIFVAFSVGLVEYLRHGQGAPARPLEAHAAVPTVTTAKATAPAAAGAVSPQPAPTVPPAALPTPPASPVVGAQPPAPTPDSASVPTPTPPAPVDRARLTVDADRLAHTLVTASLTTPLSPGRNLLWCASFQFAWDDASKAAGGTIKFAGAAPTMVDFLNSKSVTLKETDASDFFALAGFRKDGIVATMTEKLNAKFPGHPAVFDAAATAATAPQDHGLVALAYLSERFKLATPMFTAQDPLQFGGQAVAATGLWRLEKMKDWSERAREIWVVDYPSADDFIVELRSPGVPDHLVLACVPPGDTLQATVEAVMARCKKSRAHGFRQTDLFLMPAVDFQIRRRYSELLNKPVENAKLGSDVQFVEALQDTRLTWDAAGVAPTSPTYVEKINPQHPAKNQHAPVNNKNAKPHPIQEPRQFVYNRPFLVLLVHGESTVPYLALWVDNPELLVPANAAATPSGSGATQPAGAANGAGATGQPGATGAASPPQTPAISSPGAVGDAQADGGAPAPGGANAANEDDPLPGTPTPPAPKPAAKKKAPHPTTPNNRRRKVQTPPPPL
ncbi:MAG: hypothetical protein ACREJ2_07245, partial [Planctomycetota bacterium]